MKYILFLFYVYTTVKEGHHKKSIDDDFCLLTLLTYVPYIYKCAAFKIDYKSYLFISPFKTLTFIKYLPTLAKFYRSDATGRRNNCKKWKGGG